MIRAKDLRIGNLYRYLHEESESIHTVDIDFLKTQQAYDEDPDGETFGRGWLADSIPLTEEWLIKLGFTPYEKHDFSLPIHNGWSIIWQQLGYIYIKYLDIECEISHVEYRYVHQIQNLYQSLTGEELEVK